MKNISLFNNNKVWYGERERFINGFRPAPDGGLEGGN